MTKTNNRNNRWNCTRNNKGYKIKQFDRNSTKIVWNIKNNLIKVLLIID